MRRTISSIFAVLVISAGVLYCQALNTGRQYNPPGMVFSYSLLNTSGGTGVAFGATPFWMPIGPADCSFVGSSSGHCYSAVTGVHPGSEVNFFRMNVPCTASNLQLVTGTSGGSDPITITLMNNDVDTALTTSAANDTLSIDTTHRISLVQGDTPIIHITGISTSASLKSWQFTCQ